MWEIQSMWWDEIYKRKMTDHKEVRDKLLNSQEPQWCRCSTAHQLFDYLKYADSWNYENGKYNWCLTNDETLDKLVTYDTFREQHDWYNAKS